ncbi:MAG: uracil-DNA glycosylase [Treponema sp.]|jgi:DNA polymerase|nr:uracil-DNA glycosylase [Treponema sp.]
MTSLEKQNIADFLDLTNDYLSCGYLSEKKVYDFDNTENFIENTQGSKNDDSLEQIALEIKSCQNCQLGSTRKNSVPGEGVTNPLVMVIGEGPGADEDTLGRPFVGKAGQLLDKMLAAINLSRNTNCFIANIVKCRPPNNRDPYPEERAACSFFLHRQILLLNPKIILLVGNVAAQSLLKATEPVGKIRGKFFDYKIENVTIPVLVTYHPSALLHNENYKRPAWEDLKLLRTKIDG